MSNKICIRKTANCPFNPINSQIVLMTGKLVTKDSPKFSDKPQIHTLWKVSSHIFNFEANSN